jgi:integrase
MRSRDYGVTLVRGFGAMLRIVPRHLKGCGQDSESKPCPSKQRRKCPLWVKGHLDGKLIRRSLGTANWQIAAQRVAEIEAVGSVQPTRAPLTVAEAAAKFLTEAASRELRDSTLKKFRVLLTREPVPGEPSNHFSPSLVMFAKVRGIELLKGFGPDEVADFRQAWKDTGLSKLKKSERLKAFFRFAHDAGWTPTNPARNLRPPKAAIPGVVAFTAEELAGIIAACEDERLKNFILVMRYSGLAIADAVQLRPDRLDDQHLTIRRTKTGKAVRVLLPPVICGRLQTLPLLEGGYFSGTARAAIPMSRRQPGTCDGRCAGSSGRRDCQRHTLINSGTCSSGSTWSRT